MYENKGTFHKLEEYNLFYILHITEIYLIFPQKYNLHKDWGLKKYTKLNTIYLQ